MPWLAAATDPTVKVVVPLARSMATLRASSSDMHHRCCITKRHMWRRSWRLLLRGL
jgi:hypothetical protein